jgi:uncharacterized protein YecE (DUF72 family)
VTRVRIGTSGYNYPEWRGRFYPERFPAAKMLGYYAARFDTVEINYTFYRMPAPRAVAGWDAETPDGFTFALKAPRRITHDARLRDVAEPLRYFLDVARGLGPKLGPLLFQLPPTLRKEVGRLGDLLALIPPEFRVALEVRHPSWLDDEVLATLRSRNAALCVADTEGGTTPLVATADFGYLRLRDATYSEAELGHWADAVRRPEWGQAFVYFKHEESGAGPALAARLAARLGRDPA